MTVQEHLNVRLWSSFADAEVIKYPPGLGLLKSWLILQATPHHRHPGRRGRRNWPSTAIGTQKMDQCQILGQIVHSHITTSEQIRK